MTPLRRAGCRGQSLVELTLLVPILLAMVVGAFEIGIAGYNYMTAAQAVRAAGNHAAMGGTDAQVKETLLRNMRGMLSSIFFTYTIGTPSIWPPESARGSIGEVVGVRLPLRIGAYVPGLGRVVTSDIVFADVRPLGYPATISSGSVGPVIPWAVFDGHYEQGSSYVVYGGTTGGPGNWGQWGDPNPNVYQSNLTNGLPASQIVPGTIISTSPGLTPQQTFEGWIARLASGGGTWTTLQETWNRYADGSPREFLAPAIKDFPHGASEDRTVIRPVRFFLDTILAKNASGRYVPINWTLFFDTNGNPVSNPYNVLVTNYTVNAANPPLFMATFIEDGFREGEI